MFSQEVQRPDSKVCSEHMIDWQYLSLGDLAQNEFFPKSKSSGNLVPWLWRWGTAPNPGKSALETKLIFRSFCALTFHYNHVTCHLTKHEGIGEGGEFIITLFG